MKPLVFSCILIFILGKAYAQKRDTVVTSEVRIEAERISRLDFVDLEVSEKKTYDDLLFEIPLNFRSGGLNDFAAVSFRGAGINQTKVLWNGLPMNSALSGIADVSLLQSWVGTKTKITTSGDGAILGDQAVGGLINVTDVVQFGKGQNYRFIAQAASFRNYSFHGQANYSDSNWAYSVAATYRYGKNDYTFPYRRNQFWLNPKNLNGEQRLGNVQLGIAHKGSRVRHQLNYWYNQRYRELSPLVNSTTDSSYLEEYFHRIALNSNWNLGNWKCQSTLGFTADNIDYTNPKYHLQSSNHFTQFILDTKWSYRTWSIMTEMHYAISPDVSGQYTWLAGLIVDKYWFIAERHRLFTTARIAGFLNEWRVVPSFSYRYLVSTNWELCADANGVFRNPTINELYFIPGGNPNLKSEKGWNVSTGIQLRKETSSLQNLKFTLYSRYIHNWVLWYGSFIFSPYNVGSVWSRGVEIDSRWHLYRRGSWNNTLHLNAGFVASTLDEATELVFIPYEGVQLPYTPTSVLNLNLSSEYRSFGLNWKHHVQSRRSATLDPNWYLEAFYLMDIDAFYELPFAEDVSRIRLTVGIKNVTNTYYQYILNRPMPGRNYFVNFSINI